MPKAITWERLLSEADTTVNAMLLSEGVCFVLDRAYKKEIEVPPVIVMQWGDYVDLYRELGICAQPGEWMAAEFFWVTPFGKVTIRLSRARDNA